jgi:hypothetical protein
MALCPHRGACIGIEVAVFSTYYWRCRALQCPDNVSSCSAQELITRLSNLDGYHRCLYLGPWRQGGDAHDWPKRREKMSQGNAQNDIATSRRNPLAPMPWLAAFCQFVHECRACQHDVAPHWQLCTHCDLRLALSCPQCAGSISPAGAYACPCCGLAMPPVETWAPGLQP